MRHRDKNLIRKTFKQWHLGYPTQIDKIAADQYIVQTDTNVAMFLYDLRAGYIKVINRDAVRKLR